MILVADASALIALSACDSLHLLDALFGNVIVPEAVYVEVVVTQQADSHHGKFHRIGNALDGRRWLR